jgi:hypothetical protein
MFTLQSLHNQFLVKVADGLLALNRGMLTQEKWKTWLHWPLHLILPSSWWEGSTQTLALQGGGVVLLLLLLLFLVFLPLIPRSCDSRSSLVAWWRNERKSQKWGSGLKG